MTNEQRQAWQRFYCAALSGVLHQLGANPRNTEANHRVAVLAADAALRHYLPLIPPKKERDDGTR